MRWPRPWPSCWPSRLPTRSPPRWSRCRPRVWSGGWPSGCRTTSAPPPAGGDGVCAGVTFPTPAAVLDTVVADRGRHRPRGRPVAAGAAGLAAAGGDRRGRRRTVVRRARCPPGHRRPRRPAPGSPLRHRAPAGRAVRRLRAAPPGAAAASWAAGTGRRRRPELAAGALAAAAGAGRRAGSGAAAARGLRHAARRPEPGRATRTAVAVRRDPAAGRPPRPCWSRWPRTARCTSGCRTPPPRCGSGWPAGAAGVGVPPRRADPTAATARHPLLSSLGRDVRELQLRLAAAAPHAAHRHHPRPDPPPHAARAAAAPAARRPAAGRPAAGGRRRPQRAGARLPRPAPAGRGAARGGRRVAGRRRDAAAPGHPGHVPGRGDVRAAGLGGVRASTDRVPTTIPGNGCRCGWPTGRCARSTRCWTPWPPLLELADDRVTAAQALDLLASAPVRLRFGLDETELERVRTLVVRSGVRWGLDAAHRGRYRLDGLPAEHLGRRPGPAAARGGHVRRPGPGGAGRRARLVGHRAPARRRRVRGHRAGRAARRVRRPAGRGARRAGRRTAADRVDRHADRGARPAHPDSRRPRPGRTRRPGPSWPRRCAQPGRRPTPCRLGCPTCARCWPTGCAAGPPGPASAPARITVATLVPMRSVPHRVVCLLGLDDGGFPRADVPDGDDLLARDPLVGERDPRSEDRQLLLDALCAATERLVVVHSGADERTGARRPPAVPLGELLDAIAAETGVGAAGAGAPSAAAVPSAQLHPGRARPPGGRSASTGPSWPGRWPPPGRSGPRRRSCPSRWTRPRSTGSSGWTSW